MRQVNTVPLSGGGSVIPQQDDYTYDGLNRIASITEAQRDSGGTWTSNVTSQTFTYDRWGNRLSVAGYNPQSWDATEAAATNRLRVIGTTGCPASGTRVCYDAVGNLIFDNTLGSAGTRTYDAENRMITAAGSGANSYSYNADGKRTRRVVGAQTFFQVYGIGGELVGEYLWNGSTASLQKEYGYRGGEMLVVAENSATVRWLVTDHLGTPRILTDQTGTLAGVTRHDYFPFGEENLQGAQRSGNGYQADNVRQKFGSYERDTETGLDYAQARYFSGVQGRFTSVDPLHSSAIATDPQSWNRYSYVGNRPTIMIDPTGLTWGYFSGNGGNWYQWYDDEKDIEKYGGTVVHANAGAGHTYQAADGRWIRLDLSKNSWEAYDTSMQAFYGQHEFPTAMGDMANTLNLFGAAQGLGGIARFGAGARGRIFGSGASEITTLGLTETAVATELRFTQTTASANFSAEGFFAGKTIGQVSNELRSGILNPSQVPVQYIEGEGVNLIVNTRSSLSLMRSGIPRNQWNLVNVSGDAAVQANIAERLLRNGLTQQGTSTLRITGLGKNASNLR